MTDIQIAQQAVPLPIGDIAASCGIDPQYVEQYGRCKAKIDYRLLREQAQGELQLQNTQYRLVDARLGDLAAFHRTEDRRDLGLKVGGAQQVVAGLYRQNGGLFRARKVPDAVHDQVVSDDYAGKAQVLPQDTVDLRRQRGRKLTVHAGDNVVGD